ncbi:MAG: ABC transporter permease [Lachnospiraceae bacterium]|nr:ABC transporter permease [Lachnospiraceae bacterium]
MELLKNFLTADFFYTIIRVSTPLIFASLSSLVARKGGVTNITIDSTMIMAALTGVLVSAFTKNLGLALICGMLVGVVMGIFMGYFHIMMNTNMILTGVAINTFTNGAAIMILYAFTGDKGSSSMIKSLSVPNANIPIVEHIPFVGQVVSGHNLFTYVAFVLVVVCWFLMYRTPLGLHIRAVGENASAAKSVGENPTRVKLIALGLSGLFASLGGMYMSMGNMQVFIVNMTAGRGFIGVAADAMGRGNPIGAMFSALLFGTANAVANVLQINAFSTDVVMAIPYVASIMGIIIYSVLEQHKKDSRMRREIMEAKQSASIN